MPVLLHTYQPPTGRGLGYWEGPANTAHSAATKMTEFAPETQSHMPWREHRMERDTSSTPIQEHEPHNGHQPAPIHLSTYDHYQSSVLPENDQWSPAHHEEHGVSSPHSQASAGSLVHSPGSRQSSEQRPSVDMSAGSAGEHMTLSERRQEKRKMKRFR